MIQLVKVVSVEPLEGFRLALSFTDGTEGVEDISELVSQGGPMVVPLRDRAFFKRVFLSFGVPTWPNGFDLDAINLHMKLEQAGKLSRQVAAE